MSLNETCKITKSTHNDWWKVLLGHYFAETEEHYLLVPLSLQGRKNRTGDPCYCDFETDCELNDHGYDYDYVCLIQIFQSSSPCEP